MDQRPRCLPDPDRHRVAARRHHLEVYGNDASGSTGSPGWATARRSTRVRRRTSAAPPARTSWTPSARRTTTRVFFGLNGGGTAHPRPRPPPVADARPPCVTASNYAHVTAGRAYHSGGYAYARGSNQRMGLYNTFYTSTLKQTAPNYWVIGC